VTQSTGPAVSAAAPANAAMTSELLTERRGAIQA
jgi:hypothetical protein